MSNPTIREIVDAYLDDAEHIRRVASPTSIRSHFKQFLIHFGELTIDEMCAGAKKRAVGYEKHRREVDGVCDSTINREGRNWRAAQAFAVREEMITPAQTRHWPIPPQNPPRERALSHKPGGELDKLFAGLADPRTPQHLRDFVMMALYTGQRKTCILDTRIEHVDFEGDTIWFSKTQKRKTKKKRQDQPIHEDLLPVLQAAAARSKSGHIIEFRGRRVRDVRTAYQALLRRCGITERTTIHDLRRTAAQTVRDETDNLDMTAGFIGDRPEMINSTYARPRVAKNIHAMNVIAKKRAQALGA